METHDFKSAKVGDKVSHPTLGNGVIESIDHMKDYPILVRFGKKLFAFTTDGKFNIDDLIPSLYHGWNTFEIVATPMPPYKSDEWIAVSFDCNYWYIEKFIKMSGKLVETIDVYGVLRGYPYHKSISDLNKELNNIEP